MTKSQKLDLGVWIDDPPRLVLKSWYLDRLRAMGLSHVAVMLDGPEPGLEDARWTASDLRQLAEALPEHRRVLTTWVAPQKPTVSELGRKLPRLLDAFGAAGVELDVEPAGQFRERSVRGYVDADRDRSRLDDASADIARMLLTLPVCEIELTTFPGALRLMLSLAEELARCASDHVSLSAFMQLYAVRNRGSLKVGWDSALGPVRGPREGLENARQRLPERFEVQAGLAAWDTRWPGRGPYESMTVAAQSAVEGRATALRYWSSKWLCRKRGHGAKRARLRQPGGSRTAAVASEPQS